MVIEKVQRSRFIRLIFEDAKVFDVESFLRGALEIRFANAELEALSGLTGESIKLELADLSILQQIPSESWIEPTELKIPGETEVAGRLERLVSSGLILAISEDILASRLLERYAKLVTVGWHPEALGFNRSNLALEADVAGAAEELIYEARLSTAAEDAEKFIRQHGKPPTPFFEIEAREQIQLDQPLCDSNSFFEVLSARKTSRIFDLTAQLPRKHLETLLRYSFGSWGGYRVSENYYLQRKTSPSGGGLHPIEAFPLILNAEDLASGLYHFNSSKHRLDLIRSMPMAEARRLAGSFSQEQRAPRDSQLAVILVARWARNFWKYRNRINTYNVILMDAGHLSQTFYLTATALGLGAFYTAALNHRMILNEIGLDDAEYGCLGICACGIEREGAPELPIETELFG